MMLKVQLIGFLGGDPEMRYTPSGIPVTNFSVATNRRWYDRNTGEQREETTWVRVAAWDKLAENANQYLVKGSPVYVEGDRLEANGYTSRDGEVRASLELTANVIRFLPGGPRDDDEAKYDEAPTPAPAPKEQPARQSRSGNSSRNNGSGNKPKNQPRPVQNEVNEDDIPF